MENTHTWASRLTRTLIAEARTINVGRSQRRLLAPSLPATHLARATSYPSAGGTSGHACCVFAGHHAPAAEKSTHLIPA
jgi:hypothetical protein